MPRDSLECVVVLVIVVSRSILLLVRPFALKPEWIDPSDVHAQWLQTSLPPLPNVPLLLKAKGQAPIPTVIEQKHCKNLLANLPLYPLLPYPQPRQCLLQPLSAVARRVHG